MGNYIKVSPVPSNTIEKRARVSQRLITRCALWQVRPILFVAGWVCQVFSKLASDITQLNESGNNFNNHIFLERRRIRGIYALKTAIAANARNSSIGSYIYTFPRFLVVNGGLRGIYNIWIMWKRGTITWHLTNIPKVGSFISRNHNDKIVIL